jgi:soluble lytic murein transglycosylase
MAAGAAVAGLVLGGEETLPAGRRKGSSRRRNLAVGLLSAIAAASAGAAFGVVGSPNPRDEARAASAAYTAAAAVQTAQRSEERAQAAERALSEMKSRLDQLRAIGAVEELEHYRTAEKLGLDRVIKSESLLPKDKRRVLAAIVRESKRNGLDPLLVAAIIKVESRFDPFAVSHVGALGLMQLMPPTAQELSSEKLNKRHLFDPVLNIELGSSYVAQLLQRFDGDLHKALIAYNAGPSVARSLVKGSRASKRLDVYPQAVIAAYRDLSQGQKGVAPSLAQR